MKLIDHLLDRPVAVAIGQRRAGGVEAVVSGPDSIGLLPGNATISTASKETAGLMSAADKTRLEALPAVDDLPGTHEFATVGAIGAATVADLAVNHLRSAGYGTPGDGGGALHVRAGAEPSHGGKVQSADGTWWELAEAIVRPEMFGATGDGSTDDTTAFQACIDYAKSQKVGIEGTPTAIYRTTDTLWFGNDTATTGLRYARGNGARIKAEFSNAPIVDLVGIENGRRVQFTGWRIEETSGTYLPTAGIVCGRPKQASGVKSSGNMTIRDNTVYGYFSVAALYNVQSESNTLGENHFFNYHTSGHAMAMVRHDYFDDTFCLAYDGLSGTFSGGETITVGTSGATATVIRNPVDLGGSTGRMWVHVTSGTFTDNETITGGTSGATAAVNHPSGYDLIAPASPSTTLGVEDDSTSTYQVVNGNFFNCAGSTNADATVFISDWNDVSLRDNNYNHANEDAWQLHMQQDQTRNAAKSVGLAGVQATGGYHHSEHAVSMALGDPVTGGGAYSNLDLGPSRSAGAIADMDARVKWVGGATGDILDTCIDSDHVVDLRGCRLLGASTIYVRDRTYGGFYADEQIEGVLELPSLVATAGRFSITTPDTPNKLKVRWSDLALSSARARLGTTIWDGTIGISAPVMLIDTEAGAAADDLIAMALPAGVRAHGQIVALRSVSADRAITITPGAGGGNIRSRGNGRLILSNTHFTFFMYEATAGHWMHMGDVTTGADDCRGFTPGTGTSAKGSFDATTATAGEIAERLLAIEQALFAAGLIAT